MYFNLLYRVCRLWGLLRMCLGRQSWQEAGLISNRDILDYLETYGLKIKSRHCLLYLYGFCLQKTFGAENPFQEHSMEYTRVDWWATRTSTHAKTECVILHLRSKPARQIMMARMKAETMRWSWDFIYLLNQAMKQLGLIEGSVSNSPVDKEIHTSNGYKVCFQTFRFSFMHSPWPWAWPMLRTLFTHLQTIPFFQSLIEGEWRWSCRELNPLEKHTA